MAEAAKIRVIQWATGTVGASAMRAVFEHPELELVGAFVYSEAKDGRDIGELCGLAPLGIKATRDRAAILALKPDCVVYMPESTDLDDVCALLSAGINIVSTRNEFFNPEGMDTETRRRVEEACAVGKSSIHSSGSSPGFVTEALPIVLLSLVRRLDFLMIDEFADCTDGCSEEMLIAFMGFGDTPEEFAKRDLVGRDDVFEHSLSLLAKSVNLPIERWETSVEWATCTEPTTLHKTTIAAGTIGGQRLAFTGYNDGKPILSFRSNWFVTQALEPAWKLYQNAWRITVDGDTPLDITIEFPIPQDQRQLVLPRLTAHRPINAISSVVAAAPGVVPTTALPQIIANLGTTKSAIAGR